jgi:hypothetical protein
MKIIIHNVKKVLRNDLHHREVMNSCSGCINVAIPKHHYINVYHRETDNTIVTVNIFLATIYQSRLLPMPFYGICLM